MTASGIQGDPARIAEEALSDADTRVIEPEDDGTSAYLDNFAQHTFNR